MKDDPLVRAVLDGAKAHPAWGLVRRQIGVAAGLAVGAVACFVWSPIAGAAFGALAVFVGWSALTARRSAAHVVSANAAFAACRRNDYAAATLLLDVFEADSPRHTKRVMASHRAFVALAAGRAEEAVAHATRAIATPLGVFMRDAERSNVAWAYSLRALARAAMLDGAGALSDADAASDERYTTPMDLGHAELARAIVAASAGAKADVRAILARSAPFFDELGGRERRLVRDLARYARDGKRTIYRHAAKSTRDPIADWAEPLPVATRTDGPRPTPLAPARTGSVRTLALWALLVLVFLAIWQMLNPGPHPPPSADEHTALAFFVALLPVSYAALVIRTAVVAAKTRIARRKAVVRTMRGDAAAFEVLARQARRGVPEAYLELARTAERSSSFATALDDADCGIASTTRTAWARAMTYDLTAPGLVAERAFALAALGRHDEADAALASMPNAAAYMDALTAQFRVRFAQALARGDRRAALELGRESAGLPMPMRDAFLVDLLEATEGNGADDDEWSRLRAEITANSSLRKWVDHFMPDFGSGAAKRRVALPKREPALEREEELELPDAAPAVEQS